MDYIERIDALGACQAALDWLRAERHPTIEAAWAACPRGDWMLWLAEQAAPSAPWSDGRRPIVAAAASWKKTQSACADIARAMLTCPALAVG